MRLMRLYLMCLRRHMRLCVGIRMTNRWFVSS